MFSIDVMFEGPEIVPREAAHGREVHVRWHLLRACGDGSGGASGVSDGGVSGVPALAARAAAARAARRRRRRRKQHGRLNAAPLHYVPPLHHVRNRSALSSASADS